MINPAITVVTPSFNQGQYLEECIVSVLSQNYQNLEYIVIDGGSSDNSVDIIRKYEKYIEWWVSEKDRGQSHAINKGFRRATGTLITWLNSDDYYLPNGLLSIADAYNSQSEKSAVGMICGSGIKVDINGSNIKDVNTSKIGPECPKWAYRFLQPSAFYTKHAVEEIGLLDENLHYSMDWDLALRITKKYKIVYITPYISAQRMYPETKTLSGGWDRLREIAEIGRKNNGILDRNYLLFKLFYTLIQPPLLNQGARSSFNIKLAEYLRVKIKRLLGANAYMIHW